MGKKICIVCDKDVSQAKEGEEVDFDMPPYPATVWYSHGNYGSTIFDPMSETEYIECYICDDCVKKKGQHVVHVTQIRKWDKTIKTFEQHRADEIVEWEKAKAANERLKELREKKDK